MNILFFSPYYIPYISGITTYPRTVLTHLSKNHHVQVLTFRHDSALHKTESVKVSSSKNKIDIFRMPYLFKISKGFISPQSLWYYLKQINKSDVVIINLPSAEGLPLAILASLTGKKILSIFHCRVDLGPGLINRVISHILEQIVLLQLYLSHQVVGYTKDYVNSMGLPEPINNKFIYLPPPVNKLLISNAKLQQMTKQKGKRTWIGFAGRVAKEKGIDHLIKAIKKANLIDKTELVFAGPFDKEVVGESDYYLYIKSLLKKYNIKHHFFGLLNSGELGAFYKSIDVLVLPSINQTEAFGMVQAEAMQLGTPVITSDLPGVRVLVNKTGMGLVVPPANSDKLATALKRIIDHPSDFAKKSMQEKLNQFINSEKTLQKYEKIIQTLR